MSWKSATLSSVFFLTLILAAAGVSAQAERYDRKFFIQLRGVFGRFRDADLERVFDRAEPIQCSELVNEDGEWRMVAFFNEKRELGDWYHASFDEVKNDLAKFIFSGVCRGEHGPVQLATKFPVTETIDAYNQRRIGFEEIAVNDNAAVRAAFDAQSQAYSFDLPYLFLARKQDNASICAWNGPTRVVSFRYVRDCIDHR